MTDASGVHVSIDSMNSTLIEVRDDVRSLIQSVESMRSGFTDHEHRLRELESHGSVNAQELDKEMVRTRSRLHSIENNLAVVGLKVDVDKDEWTKALSDEKAERLATRKTLLQLVFSALTIAGAVLVALVYVLAK